MIEKRTHPRVPLGLSVTLRRADGTSFAGTARDISIGGMFVVSGQRLEFGTELSISLPSLLVGALPSLSAGPVPSGVTQEDLVFPAIVRWAAQGGFGVQFGLIGARETHALTEFIADYWSRNP